MALLNTQNLKAKSKQMRHTPAQSIFFVLKHIQLPSQTFEMPLHQQKIMIGRKGFGADIGIEAGGVSRIHAYIERADKGLLKIRDAGSTNGTYLNGIKIENSDLRRGDVITFQRNNPDYFLIVNDDKVSTSLSVTSESFTPIEHLIEPSQTLYELLAQKKSIVIGRQDCDITLANLTISRKHTQITKQAEGRYLVKDLGSKNGTFINGNQIFSPTEVNEKDLIQLGRYEFRLDKPFDTQALPLEDEIVLIASQLTRLVGKAPERKAILRNVNLEIKAGEVVAIMGPSGSGKSTLLKALNGDAPATDGTVYVHGRDFYKNYKILKQDIGYVPQDDIVHGQLSVYDSLYFAARLRLESDVSKQEIDTKIAEILAKLGISHTKEALVKTLSGGQRKRVSIAVELLSDPSILFLDEPTSPLDPETIEEFLKILKSLAASGTTILMVTHKPDDLDSADKVAFLSRGGYLVYYGDTKNYLAHFEANNVIGVYAQINDVEKGRLRAAAFLSQKPDIAESQTGNGNAKVIEPRRKAPLRQFYWLTLRYFKIKTNDRINTTLIVSQAPIIALFLAILFEKMMLQTLFLMVIAAIWLGTSNAAREIISELPIYRRERMFNLQILPYIFSKITVINFFALLQVLLLVAILSISVGIENLWANVGLLLLLSFVGSLLGLWLSSLFDNADKVTSLVPLVLLPQIMLAGVIQRLNTTSEWLSFLTIARWGVESSAKIESQAYFYYPEKIPNKTYFEALKEITPLDTLRQREVKDSLAQLQVPDTLYQYVAEPILGNSNMLDFPTYFSLSETFLFLGLHTIVLFTAIYVSLRRKDNL